MTESDRKPGERPAHVKPPAHLSKSKPVPKPDPIEKADAITGKGGPTRYGDWEHKGIAVDF
ncbi:MAG: hypothetical protein ACI9TB_001245 [Parasphingorhabdus sp.]|jgi:hypothetical protein|uniref:DUF1674 domain-containing protein n=1 Tax=Parasphingorhabdus sp. TaxID=2709688 RepID=UPI002B264A5B|nr:DUF1674 domain-containing protein [Parasphingorhabdus sp.]